MKKLTALCVLFLLLACPLVFSQDDGAAKSVGEELLLNDLNLKVTIPRGWFSIRNSNPHFIASVASAERPRYEDTRYGFYFDVLGKNALGRLMEETAKGKASLTQQRTLIKLGEPEKVSIAGFEGKEELYLFTIRGQAYMYAVVGFEKDGIGFIADHWTPRDEGSREQFANFRSWMKDGISFLDPSKNVNDLFKKRLNDEEGDVREMIRKLESKPDPRGYIVLGMYYANKRDLQRAEEAYKKAIEIDPNSADSCEAIGIFYGKHERYKESLRFLQKAVDLQPKNSDFVSNLAGTYLVAGERKKSIQMYQEAIALDPGDAMTRLRLAQAYWVTGDKEKAVSTVDEVLKRDPQNQTALLLLKSIKGESFQGNQGISGNPVISNFQKANYGDQKKFLEKELPEDTTVLKLSKQALLAEHAGKFAEAKWCYEQLLSRKEEVTAVQGEGAWPMLHCAVQRMSELTGDVAREKEMLIWIKANMLDPQGSSHQFLSFLMPNVIDHLNKQIKKYQL